MLRHLTRCALLSIFGIFGAPLLLCNPLLTVGSSTAPIGANFNVPVSISAASDLFAFQFDLTWQPTILQLLTISEGPLLPSVGTTFYIPGAIDNVLGSSTFTADSLIGLVPGVNGNGILATLNFEVVNAGSTALVLSNVILLDSNLNNETFTTQPGQVSIGSVPEPCGIWLVATGLSFLWALRRGHLRR